ncbi:hypothetical protein FOA43_001830 [Brettanomyces nanus]|uniref:CrcB-like protein n=1 Tax=Eeniella nana TaxID=13502 RepID=A0A875RP29_EENNA|nr:uncharacterized protein FOA43_001830 [Brettanomyces nanus]QPG74500.1 hypothetical protein FOA43_001830 [Brettanomyces nanus]
MKTDEIHQQLDVPPTKQEVETARQVKPLRMPHFIRARGIANVEEAPYSKRYIVILQIVFFTILGTISRLAMIRLTNYEGAYINYSLGTCLWCNFTSCFVLGLCNNLFTFWSSVLKGSNKTNMKQFAMHTGITFGFCGAFSSLAALLVEATFKADNIVSGGYNASSRGYGATEFFGVIFVQMGVCVLGYLLGKDTAALLDIFKGTALLARYWKYRNVRIAENIFAALGLLGIIGNILAVGLLPLSNSYKKHYAIPVLLGIPGSLLRFHLSWMNGALSLADWFPLGTLVSNMCSTTIMGALNILLYGYYDKAEGTMIVTVPVQRIVVKAFETGFCGCLSSIASVMNELYNLDHPVQRYTYSFITFLCCWLPIFIIGSAYNWTRGFNTDYGV